MSEQSNLSVRDILLFPVDCFNKIPYIDAIIHATLITLLPVPFVFVPGLLSIPYLLVPLLICYLMFFTKASLIRFISPIIMVYSLLHGITAIVFDVLINTNDGSESQSQFINEGNNGLYLMLGLYFNSSYFVCSIVHIVSLFVISIISLLSCFKRSQNRPITSNLSVKVAPLFLFALAFFVNTSLGGVIPVCIFVFSIILFFIPRKVFIILWVITTVFLMCYLAILPIWGVLASTSRQTEFIELDESVNELIGSIGFSVVELPNWMYSIMMYLTYISYICYTSIVAVNRISRKITECSSCLAKKVDYKLLEEEESEEVVKVESTNEAETTVRFRNVHGKDVEEENETESDKVLKSVTIKNISRLVELCNQRT